MEKQQDEFCIAYWGNFEEYHQVLPKSLCHMVGPRTRRYWTPITSLEYILENNKLDQWVNHELYEFMLDPGKAFGESMAKFLKCIHSHNRVDKVSYYNLKEMLRLVPEKVSWSPLFDLKHRVVEAFTTNIKDWLEPDEVVVVIHQNVAYAKVSSSRME